MAKEKVNKVHILFVEDDRNLNAVIEDILKFKGYDVVSCYDGQTALMYYKNQKFDLLIIDVMIPNIDGFTLCREIRKYDEFTPIIFLTAKNTKADTLEGYKAGADDYITKPFDVEELTARIEAVLKRTRFSESMIQKAEREILKIGEYEFDTQNLTLSFKGNKRKLTKKEGQLLKLLYLKKNEVLARSLALRVIWGTDDVYGAGRSIDVYISKLRKYLEQDKSIEIQNVHGIGFKLMIKEEQ